MYAHKHSCHAHEIKKRKTKPKAKCYDVVTPPFILETTHVLDPTLPPILQNLSQRHTQVLRLIIAPILQNLLLRHMQVKLLP